MKNNSRKRGGFTFLEVIISLAIIGIISVGVYNCYLLLIRQTKDGEVKQTAALEGKQVLEEIKATTFVKHGTNYCIEINGVELNQPQVNGIVKYSIIDGDYTKEVTFKKTKTEKNTDLSSSNNQSSSLEGTGFAKVYLVKEASKYYITNNQDNINSGQELECKSDSSNFKELIISVYLNAGVEENLKIYDYKAKNFFKKTANISNGLVINFGKYRNDDGSIPTDIKSLKINIYNETNNCYSIYLQKPTTIDAEVNVYKGDINVYNNRAENETEIGNLYDITINVKKGNGILFTGNSKQNIVGWD